MEIDGKKIIWPKVERVLVVRLRSIGDTVLATPSLIALKRFLPNAEVDILLEDWVAPLLDGFGSVDNVIRVGKGLGDRIRIAREIRNRRYDVVFNLHGGSTSTLLTAASGAAHRIGYIGYKYPARYNHLLSSSSDFWHQEFTHSAEQQLALLGFVDVPVEDRPKSRLAVTADALESLEKKLHAKSQRQQSDEALSRISRSDGKSDWFDTGEFALLHPAAAFATKQWPTEHFARTAEFLAEQGLRCIAVAARNESEVLAELTRSASVPIVTFDDLTLPEITALASKSRLFVGNDSGIAHIAAAVKTPTVVIFGSSNRNHWRPWTDAPNEIVFEEFACQPCAGYECNEFGEPRCILTIPPEKVFSAISTVLERSNKNGG